MVFADKIFLHELKKAPFFETGRNMSLSIQKKLVDFICRNYMAEEDSLLLDESLVEQGLIDSFGLVEISTFVTHEFGIVVVTNDMKRSNFGSVLKIVEFIKSKLIQQKNEGVITEVPYLKEPIEIEDGEL